MNNEELISEGILEDLFALTEHERIPTKLELDRFIRGLGYRKVKGKPPVLSEEEIVEVSGKAYGQAKEQGKYDFRAELIARTAIAQVQREKDIEFYEQQYDKSI